MKAAAHWLRNLPLPHKVLLAVLAACTVALLVACGLLASYLQAGIDGFYAPAVLFTGIAALVLLGSLGFALLLFSSLQHSISAPLAELTALRAEVAARERDERRVHSEFRRLDLLHRITRAMHERTDLKSAFQEVIARLENQLPIDFGCVCLYDPRRNVLTVTSVGARSEALAAELSAGETAIVDVAANGLAPCLEGQLFYEPDVSHSAHPFVQRLARSQLGSLVAAPLAFDGHVGGVLLTARRQPQGFESAEREFLGELAAQIALAAHQLQLHGTLQQAYDDLRHAQQVASGATRDIRDALAPVPLSAGSIPEGEDGQRPATPLRILVVDDEPLFLKSLGDVLQSDGHLVTTANGGEAGIEVFRSAAQRGEHFAVVITDLGMPYVDGRKVASAVKEASPTTPVLLMTGWGQRLNSAGGIPAHVDRVLSKPPQMRDLREALAGCLKRARPRDITVQSA